MIFQDEFFLRALIVSSAVVLSACPLGCFVVWKRLAYFGDSMAHVAILGLSLGLISGYGGSIWMVLPLVFISSLILYVLRKKSFIPNDSLLGILSHGSLAFAVIIISQSGASTFSLTSYLFGDILSISDADIYGIVGLSLLVISLLVINFRILIAICIDEEIAASEGQSTIFGYVLFLALTAIVTVSAIKVVGVLLAVSLLIIPANSARFISSSPYSMLIKSSVIGLCGSVIGLLCAFYFDFPVGPSISASCFSVFIILASYSFLRYGRY